jgi:hypothetical protein
MWESGNRAIFDRAIGNGKWMWQSSICDLTIGVPLPLGDCRWNIA